jgi:hypothetical protein
MLTAPTVHPIRNARALHRPRIALRRFVENCAAPIFDAARFMLISCTHDTDSDLPDSEMQMAPFEPTVAGITTTAFRALVGHPGGYYVPTGGDGQ